MVESRHHHKHPEGVASKSLVINYKPLGYLWQISYYRLLYNRTIDKRASFSLNEILWVGFYSAISGPSHGSPCYICMPNINQLFNRRYPIIFHKGIPCNEA